MKLFIGSKLYCNWCITFAYQNNKIIENSNDFFSLLKNLESFQTQRNLIISKFDFLKNYNLIDYNFNETLILGINPFYKGTLHGYAFVYQVLHFCLFENKINKVLLSFDCQKGIKELYEKVLGPHRIVYVFSKKNNLDGLLIECKNLIFVENKFHSMVPYNIFDTIMPLILNINVEKKMSISLIKSNSTQNLINHGVLDSNQIKNLDIPKRFIHIDPSKINECDWASLVYYSKEIVVTWGTAHFKLLHYLPPENCIEKLTVLVINEYIEQYNIMIERQKSFLQETELNWGKNRTLIRNYVIYNQDVRLSDI